MTAPITRAPAHASSFGPTPLNHRICMSFNPASARPDVYRVTEVITGALGEAIRPGGISKVKSVRIKAILQSIGDPLDLTWMREAPIAESQAYLTALPGVGRKTAACVLLFSYGLRDVPVDTHVSRVGMRLHLLEPGAPFDRLHDQMLAITPPGAELEFHVNLLRHGRRTCHAQRPACGVCALRRMCPSRRE